MLFTIEITPKFWFKRYHLSKIILALIMVFAVKSFGKSSRNLVGTNLSEINYYSTQLPFVNEFNSSHPWLTQNIGAWDTKESHLLDLDEQGWVKSLPNDTSPAQYDTVSTLIFRNGGKYLPGKYVVLYEGEGNINYSFDAKKNEALSSPGRDIIEANPSPSGIRLSITATDPNNTGDYIRNIRIVPESQESLANSETFNPEFIEKIEPFGTLRFMDWMDTNNSEQSEWSERPKKQDIRYSKYGAPVEIMVELANLTDTDPWFTIPHLATDEYVQNFAQYVEDNLDPDLDIYVEYSNEVWNGMFGQSRWAAEQADREWSDPNLGKLDWYSRRTTEVVKIWDNVFTGDSERVIGVMSAQAANPWTGQKVLNYDWNDVPLSHSETGIDAIAIAPYFGSYIGLPANEPQLNQWTQEADGGLDKLFQEIESGGLLQNSPMGGALAAAYRNIDAYAELAQQEGLELLAYEGGQHLVGVGSAVSNQAIADMFTAANRDPRMGAIYQEYLQEWSDRGGDLFVNFNDIEKSSKFGHWGALESVNQDSSPKYDAIVDFIKNPTLGNRSIGEVGSISNFNHQSQTIEFQNSYINPVVFALPLSQNGGDPAIARIIEIDSDSFTAFLQEPEYKDGKHVNENVNYLVLEAGSWQLDDGSLLEVGVINSDKVASSGWEYVCFDNSFSNTPVVLSQVQTQNDSQFVTTRQRTPSVDGFSLTMQEEEALKNSDRGAENIGWLAIEPGTGSIGDLSYQADSTGDRVTHRWQTIDLDDSFAESPYVLASLASYDGGDTATLRHRSSNNNLVQVRVEEEKSSDPEIFHTTETVDFLALSGSGDIIASSYDSSSLI